MKLKIILAATGLAATGLALAAGAATAQQISPMTNDAAATACAPGDMAGAVACLEQFLKPEVKADIAKANNPDTVLAQSIYVGMWARNNWGLWTGSPLSQFMLSKRITQPEAMGTRILQAYWLKTKGCAYDFNNVGYVTGGMNKLNAGADPCSVTVAEANTSMAPAAPRAARGGAAAAAAGRAGAPPAAGLPPAAAGR